MSDTEKDESDLMRTTVVLEKKYVEWAKEQPGGLSLLMRALLKQVYDGKIKVEYPIKPPTLTQRN